MLKRIKIQTLLNNPWVLLGVAVVAAGLLTLWIYWFLSGREAAMRESMMASMNAQRHVAVLVPVTDMKAGAAITSAGFAAREVPIDYVYDDTIRASEFDAIANQTLVRPVRHGTPVRRADVSALQARDFSDMLKPGMRALTIDIDATNSADNMLKPGNHIDLFLIGKPSPNKMKGQMPGADAESARLFLSDLVVLATGQDVRPRDYGEEMSQGDGAQQPSGYASVTLQVTPEQAGKVALAQKIGSLRAVLRNREDKNVTPPVNVMQASLFGDGAGADGIQYIVGGSNETSVSTRPGLDLHGLQDAVAGANQAQASAVQKVAKMTDAQTRVMSQIQSMMSGAGQRQ
uniref:Flp pilus assembly protein CpaB n=1 Tax=Burkholderia anthina TaxID=179879 RepID=UPI001588B177|nr:Flp pilus assembly protein CpaB [Burkholderia anthina]